MSGTNVAAGQAEADSKAEGDTAGPVLETQRPLLRNHGRAKLHG